LAQAVEVIALAACGAIMNQIKLALPMMASTDKKKNHFYFVTTSMNILSGIGGTKGPKQLAYASLDAAFWPSQQGSELSSQGSIGSIQGTHVLLGVSTTTTACFSHLF
jgi:hypothetical protein